MVTWQALGAQRDRSAWLIAIKTEITKSTLLRTNLSINNKEIPLYGDNPFMKGVSPFLNGDRYIFAKNPPLPDRVKIGRYNCRVWYG